MMDNILQAFQAVFSHKLRSFLTMLGIIIGIASIITIISTIKGTNDQIKENLIGAGNNVVSVRLYQQDMEYDMMYSANPVGIRIIKDSDKKALEDKKGIDEVSLYRQRTYSYNVYYQNTAFNGMTFGIDESYFSVNGYQIKQGRLFTAKDYARVRKSVILDETAAKVLFGTEDPVGKILELEGEPFTVVGVVALKSAFVPRIETEDDYALYMTSGNSGKLFVPSPVWPVLYRFDEPQSVDIRAASTDDMTNAGKAVADYLNQTVVSEAARGNGLSYRSNDLLEQAEQLQAMSSAANNQLLWIAAISLLVGGIGVMNIMLVTVTERTREIGLKKALGARRRRILGQFLTEAAVLTGIGGILGVAAGIGMSELISHVMETPSAISIPAILLAAIFSVAFGLIFGIVPAVKASKLNPIEALRRD